MPRRKNPPSRSRSVSRSATPPARRRRRRSTDDEARSRRRRETTPPLTASQDARIRAILRERVDPPPQPAPPAAHAAPPQDEEGEVFPVAVPGAVQRGGRGGRGQRGRQNRGRGKRSVLVARAVESFTPGPDIAICRRHNTTLCHICMYFNPAE